MQEAALARLGEIGESASLRHAVQLLTPAHVLAKSCGRRACTLCPHLEPRGLTCKEAQKLPAGMPAFGGQGADRVRFHNTRV